LLDQTPGLKESAILCVLELVKVKCNDILVTGSRGLYDCDWLALLSERSTGIPSCLRLSMPRAMMGLEGLNEKHSMISLGLKPAAFQLVV
jgi:hypothetical protein